MAKPKPGAQPEPEPVDKLQERLYVVDDVKQEIQASILEIAGRNAISTAEIIFILSDLMTDFAREVMLYDHDQRFGPGAEESGE